MSRYFVRPRANKPRAAWDDDVPLLPDLDVPDHEPTDTGLINKNGDTIWRGPNEIGFHNPRERS